MAEIAAPDPEVLEVLIKKIALPIREHSMKSARSDQSKVDILNALACVAGMAIFGADKTVDGALEFFENAVRNQYARMIAEATKPKGPTPPSVILP